MTKREKAADRLGSAMKKTRKSAKKKKTEVIFDPCLTVHELNEEFPPTSYIKKTRVYVDIDDGGPILKVLSAYFYPSGIQGQPSLVLKIESLKVPEHTPFEVAITRHIVGFLRALAEAKGQK